MKDQVSLSLQVAWYQRDIRQDCLRSMALHFPLFS